jgi:phage-related holin
MNHLIRLLKTFDFHDFTAFGQSLMPSHRYGGTTVLMIVCAVWVSVDKVFGLDSGAFVALGCVFVAELVTGIVAAHMRGETISSVKLSRFSLKVACYLVLIAVSYLMAQSFANHKQDVAGAVFDWLHIFLVAQIVLENIVSILENLAVINGKDKSAWISKIQEKFNTLLN